MGFGRRVSLAFRAFWHLLRSGTLPDDLVCRGGRGTGRRPAPPRRVVLAPAPVERPDDGAVLLLSVLQREGRLVDFLMEDLGTYADAQIGAAVRDVHASCRRALASAFELEPILEGAEEQADHGAERLRPRLDQAGGPCRRRRTVPRRAAASRVAVVPRAAARARRPGRTADRRSRRSRSLLSIAERPTRGTPFHCRDRSRHDQLRARRGRARTRARSARPIEVRGDPAAREPARGRVAAAAAVVPVPAERCGLPGGQPRAAVGRPAPRGIVGELARKRGAENPARLVASAKSWLSYGAANRTRRDPAVGRAGGGAARSRRSTRRPRTSATCATPGTTSPAGASRTRTCC